MQRGYYMPNRNSTHCSRHQCPYWRPLRAGFQGRAPRVLEHKPEAELPVSWAVVLAVDHTEAIPAERCIRRAEPGCIERVEKLRANLDVFAFRELYPLRETQVYIVNALIAAIGDVSAHISGRLVRRMRKVANVEVIRRAVHNAVDTHAGARLPADVGTLVRAVGKRLIAIREHDGISGLEGDEAIYLPATDGPIHNAVHV